MRNDDLSLLDIDDRNIYGDGGLNRGEEKMCKFSIIVPVYQAEEYLQECIYSVINQNEESWELILVDDGSTDKSVQVCDSFTERDFRIKTIHQENAGPISARCKGFEMAKGTYLLSLDADDRLAQNALGRIDAVLSQTEIDILVFGYRRIDIKGRYTKTEYCFKDIIYSKSQKKDLFLKLWEKNAFNLVWNKVFRRDFIHKNLRIPENLKNIRTGDDAIIVTQLLIQADKIRTVEDMLYEYRIVPDSITRKFDPKSGEDIIQYRSYMLDQIKKADLLCSEIETVFFQVTYRTISYVLWQCARSNNSRKEKISFLCNMSTQELYRESLSYAEKVKFSARKRFSMWLYNHEMFYNFIRIEKFQNYINHLICTVLCNYRRKNE